MTVLCPPADEEGVFQSPGLIKGPDPTELPPSPDPAKTSLLAEAAVAAAHHSLGSKV